MALLQPVENPRGLRGRRRLDVFNPATLERLGEIEIATTEDVRYAVERARKAAIDWRDLSYEQRGRHLLRLRDRIVDGADEIAETICRDTGKPRLEAVSAEVLTACEAITYYARKAKLLLRDEKKALRLMKTKKLVIRYRPMGVVGLITPWNFPFVLSLNPIVQALMAGNTVVLKPSEVTPFVGLRIADLFREAGFPEGALEVVTGDGSTGAALVEAGCDKISFTGSVRTGRQVAEVCGRQLIPCTLELGGKDAMIVCSDANIERAARGAVYGAFSNSGQICVSTERVYVSEEVAKPFIDRVLELTRELRQGPESEGGIDLGAMTSPPQLEIVEEHLRDAVEKGAQVLTGGRRNPNYKGYFFEPTVLTQVNHEMKVMQEETFGPVLPIQVVRDDEEALQQANETRYGLSASVWTRDRYRGNQIADRIDSGCVVIGDCLITYGIPESPFGGVKDSGVGRVNGEIGIRGLCQGRSIVSDRFGRKTEPFWYPYTGKKLRTAKRLIGWLYRSPLGKLLGS